MLWAELRGKLAMTASLTDIASIDHLRRLAIDPLLSLDEGWDLAKLPKDLPTWS